MKTTLDKKCITLDQFEDAKNMMTEWKKYDRETLETVVMGAINANLSRIDESRMGYHNPARIIEISQCEITMNRFRLTAWIDCMVQFDSASIVKMSFDGVDAMSYCDGQKVDAYIEVYRREK